MPTKVVFIAGAGRSGSTFLSQLLSQADDCQTVGQIRHLPMSMGGNRVCSCGQELAACGYWGRVAARLADKHGDTAMTRLKRGLNQFQKAAEDRTDWSQEQTRRDLAAAHGAFLAVLADLYHFAAEEADGRTLIDSSKIPSVAFALALIEDIDLYTLNLVRDPRAVSVSWAKLVRNPQTLKQRCRNWNRRAQQMAEFSQIPNQPFRRIAYEAFASTPRPMIEEIQAWAGLAQDTSFFIDDHSAQISWDRTHLFPPANEEVLERKATRIDIRPSESWKSEAHQAARELAQKINFPQARELGYKKKIA